MGKEKESMNLLRGQAGCNTSRYELYKFTLLGGISVEYHDVVVSNSKLIAQRITMLLVRKQNLTHKRTSGIHTLQHIKKKSKRRVKNYFFELTEMKVK